LKSVLRLLPFCLLSFTAVLLADPAPDYFFTQYEITDLDFIRQYYYQIENERMVQFEGHFSSYEWKKPFEYREKLKAVGLNVAQYNILKFILKENDDLHYSFPLLLFPTQAGDLNELNGLVPGDRVVIYGKFYNLEKSEYAVVVHVIETVRKGGHDREVLIDSRLPATPTPTVTVTPTPAPSLLDRFKSLVNPPTEQPTGTVTPGN